MKRILIGVTLAAALATGTVVAVPAAPVIARDTGWPCPGC